MDAILCACGCGQSRPALDAKGRPRKYINNHQNREKTKKQIKAAVQSMNNIRPKTPWNKGKAYIHKSKKVYANKGAWGKALRCVYGNACMKCGWCEAACDAHHLIPKSGGGKYSIDNGIILCPNHHRLANLGIITDSDLRRIKDAI